MKSRTGVWNRQGRKNSGNSDSSSANQKNTNKSNSEMIEEMGEGKKPTNSEENMQSQPKVEHAKVNPRSVRIQFRDSTARTDTPPLKDNGDRGEEFRLPTPPILEEEHSEEIDYSDIKHEEGEYPAQSKDDQPLLKEKQKRRHSLSVACSQEEARILRQAAFDKGMTFSNWARKTLFRSAGKRIPTRPK